jgi:hypothetical protein
VKKPVPTTAADGEALDTPRDARASAEGARRKPGASMSARATAADAAVAGCYSTSTTPLVVLVGDRRRHMASRICLHYVGVARGARSNVS